MAKRGVSIATHMLNDFNSEGVKDILDKKEWMENPKLSFRLLTTQKDVEEYIDFLIENKICALDLETTGLNTRLNEDGRSASTIVGICMASSAMEGVYVPVAHVDREYNVAESFMIEQLRRLCANCVCIYHNFKYDGQILWNYGIYITDENMYEDTMLMAAVEDSSRKQKGLKPLSEMLLKRPMLSIDGLGVLTNNKKVVSFDMVPPARALYYGAPDAMNSFGLYKLFKYRLDNQDPTGRSGPWAIYKVEKRCTFVTMEMERNYVRIDIPYLKQKREEVITKLKTLKSSMYDIAGREFDIDSPKQLGELLFNELKYVYPIKDKTASGQYMTGGEILEKIQDKYPIVDLIMKHRKLEKILGTYIENFIKNADSNNEVKFQLNQVRAETGRFNSTGGGGLLVDGYSGVNCQNIPAPNDDNPDAINLRRALLAHAGFKIVTIDYSGEELRIAANLSREPMWIKEFLEGTGDLHTLTTKAILRKDKISKKERKLGKTINFLTMYGGGPAGFAAQAKITIDTAKKMIINFFTAYKGLNNWITEESKRCRKRGYSSTALGRRRPLTEYYTNEDRRIQAKGDRLAINSQIQGCGSDIIKIALFRVWKWIHENGFEDDVKIIMPIHDEIVFEIKEDKLDFYIPELCELMVIRDIVDKLGWPVPFEVDAEYGDTLSITNDYWKEKRAKKKEEGPTVESKQDTTVSDPVYNETPVKGKEDEEEKKSIFPQSAREIVSENKGDQGLVPLVAKEFVALDEIELKEKLSERIDNEGYFIYSINNDAISAKQVGVILHVLKMSKGIFEGPKFKICLVTKKGEVLFRSKHEFCIDAFVMACLLYNI